MEKKNALAARSPSTPSRGTVNSRHDSIVSMLPTTTSTAAASIISGEIELIACQTASRCCPIHQPMAAMAPRVSTIETTREAVRRLVVVIGHLPVAVP